MQREQSATAAAPLPIRAVPAEKRQGRKTLPVERRRVIMSERVLPSTMEYLQRMGYPTVGRAIDVLVKAVQHEGIVKMIESKSQFSIVNLVG